MKFGRTNITFRKSEEHVAFRRNGAAPQGQLHTEEAYTQHVQGVSRERIANFNVLRADPTITDIEAAKGRARIIADADFEKPVTVYHTSDDNVPFVPEGTLHLAFSKGVSADDIAAFARSEGLRIAQEPKDGFYTADVSHQDRDPVEIADALQSSRLIALAEPDLSTPVSFLMDLPDGKLVDHQWHLRNTGLRDGVANFGLKAGADARVFAAWERMGHLGNPDVVLAMIDDGFDIHHPDLANIALHPWDFVHASTDVRPKPDANADGGGDWHGTACAGIAVARAGGGQTVGVAPTAQFMPLRMAKHLSPTGVEAWFDYAKDHGAWVISASWNAKAKVYALPERVYQALSRAATQGRDGKGCVLVFAAGNSGQDVNDLPNALNGFATHPDVLAVAASTSVDSKATYSDTGAEIAVCAPSGGRGGIAITTDDATGTYQTSNGEEMPMGYFAGDYYSAFSGTSAACPIVAGVCALVLGENPALTAEQVRAIIRQTARKIGDDAGYTDGHSPAFGHGCVDADAAVAQAIALKTDPQLLATFQAQLTTQASA